MLNANTLTNAPSIAPHIAQHDDSRLGLWLNKLPNTSLPINSATANHIARLLDDEHCDSDKLAQRIKQDPILCLKLFHCAKQALAKREGDIQHLVHLIGLIGMNKVEQVISHNPKKNIVPDGFNEILSASIFAAHLSNTLLINKHHGQNDRFFLPTLFFNSPLWLMWIAAPKAMTQGQALASRQQQPYESLCLKKLGFQLSDFQNQVPDVIDLPLLTQQALAIRPTQELRFWARAHHLNDSAFSLWLAQDKLAKQLFYSVEMGIYLLNQYVLAIYLDWNGKHIKRYAHLLSRHLGIEASALHKHMTESALSIRLPTHLKGVFSPICRIKGLHKEDLPASTQAPSPLSHTQHAKKEPSLNKWLVKMRQSKSVNTAYHTTLLALSQGAKVNHCIIMNVDKESIHTHACYGFDDSSRMHSFYYDQHHTSPLFHQLMQKPSCISITANNMQKAMRNIPADFSQLVDMQSCAFISIFSHGQVQAIIYCDHSQWDEKKHHSFKLISKSLSKALDHLL